VWAKASILIWGFLTEETAPEWQIIAVGVGGERLWQPGGVPLECNQKTPPTNKTKPLPTRHRCPARNVLRQGEKSGRGRGGLGGGVVIREEADICERGRELTWRAGHGVWLGSREGRGKAPM